MTEISIDGRAATPVTAPTSTVSTTVTQRVTATQLPSGSRGYLSRPDEQWTWSDLRDYVVHQIESRFGVFPRDSKKEYGIFSGFIGRWGAVPAVAIARHAFEVENGWWRSAPITVNRFTKNADSYFALIIAEKLVAA